MSEGAKVRSSKKTKNVFEEELKVLKHSKAFLENDELTLDQCKRELEGLQKHYDELLDQTKLITKVSDRLQKKINKANDDLESKNVELQESLDALTKARVGRKATTITLIVVVVLFLITEAWIEPYIEDFAAVNFQGDYATTFASLGAKAAIALLLRPIEKVVENRLMKREAERLSLEKEAKKNAPAV